MEEERLIGAIGQSDITALTHILYFYERWMLNNLAPSAKRTKNVSEVQFLTVKLSLLPTAKTMELTYEDIEHITYAIRTFIAQMNARIQHSQNRDDVIESSEGLLKHIITVFAPKQT